MFPTVDESLGNVMNRENIDKLITEALAIEAHEAVEAGAVGFMARAMTLATLPYRVTSGTEFTRSNGLFTLRIVAPSNVGLPYGSYPRLLLSWLTTEAVRTRSPVLELGPTLSGFMTELGLIPAGGRWGTIHRLRDQMRRFFSSMVSCSYSDKTQDGETGFRITKEYKLWWDPKAPEQPPFWKSTVTLSLDFFEEIIKKPVPVDMRAFKALKQSPMALDIYCWLTYRMSYMRKPVEIPWPALQMQFGADYANDAQGIRNFKRNFLNQLKSVLVVYPGAKAEPGEIGLILKPGKSHIAKHSVHIIDVQTTEQQTLSSPALSTPTVEPPAPLPSPTPVLVSLPKPALTPAPSKMVESSVIRLSTETYEKAKKVAPGWDVYALEHDWREWVKDKERPKDPDAAFIGFCKQRFQKKGRP